MGDLLIHFVTRLILKKKVEHSVKAMYLEEWVVGLPSIRDEKQMTVPAQPRDS